MTGVPANGSAYRIRHLALEVADLEKAVAFYRTVFGMKVLRRRANPDRNDVAAYVGYGDESSEVSIELYQFLGVPTLPQLPSRSHVAIAVTHIETFFERAVAAGAMAQVRPQNNRPGSANKFAFIFDPDGHEIELTESAMGGRG